MVLIILCFSAFELSAQVIPSNRILEIEELSNYLKPETKVALKGDFSTTNLAKYFKVKFSVRFFYDHQTVDDRIAMYNEVYGNQTDHEKRAMDHMGKYADSTQWVLPFNYLNGEAVNAYALRHLARQHKMVDIALHYFNDGKDPKYITYFTNQQRSLKAAFEQEKYEKIEDGNGVYEVFRSGYRMLNWLWIHNLFLNEEAYSDNNQLETIAMILHHAADLYKHNSEFHPGNHQTRGMSALAMLGILFRDFEGADLWLERAMQRLGEHLDKEINADGFQFERSVHYHMSDINNYFYVYQLAKINQIQVSEVWEEKLKTLFATLAKIAYPDKSAPVLQDDTEDPWAEKNEISKVMTLGYLLFEDPAFGYFATDQVNGKLYWFLQKDQFESLKNIEKEKPKWRSLSFPNTHYYIMREGWNEDDKMMIISAGLDSEKPDHQHGDMLGVQAMANGQVILPNYQVRYSLSDFELFKNSMVKNVALVDDELQGKEWTSNKGGSGFGKFSNLPEPKVITWNSNDKFDLFVGSHNGFEDIGVNYTRQVIFIKNDFWIVKDKFLSNTVHTFKQVWQGHYTEELGPNLIRETFADASGCDILQLNKIDHSKQEGSRGKNWNILSKENESKFSFVTAIFPFKGYQNRIDESRHITQIKDWQLNQSDWEMIGENPISLSKNQENYFFNVQQLEFGKLIVQFAEATDLYLENSTDKINLTLLSDSKRSISIIKEGVELTKNDQKEIQPGRSLVMDLASRN